MALLVLITYKVSNYNPIQKANKSPLFFFETTPANKLLTGSLVGKALTFQNRG